MDSAAKAAPTVFGMAEPDQGTYERAQRPDLPSIAAAFAPGGSCRGHCDDGHVCEEHPDMPWPHTACDAAGMPCPDRECRGA